MIGRRCKHSNMFSCPILICRSFFTTFPDLSSYVFFSELLFSSFRRCLGYGSPVPFPNTAVKHTTAYHTLPATARKPRYSPIYSLTTFELYSKSFYFISRGGSGEVVNTSDCGSDMRGFDSHESPHRGIAQLVEQRSPKP